MTASPTERMNQKTLVRRGPLTVLRALLIFVLILGALLLGGCTSNEEEGNSNAPTTTAQPTEETTTAEEAASNVVVEVSGTQGTAYTGAYGPFTKAQAVNSTLGATATDYEVRIEGGSLEGVSAVFRKTQPGDEGILKVEILVNGEVVAEDETSEEFGVVSTSWSPRGSTVVEHPGER